MFKRIYNMFTRKINSKDKKTNKGKNTKSPEIIFEPQSAFKQIMETPPKMVKEVITKSYKSTRRYKSKKHRRK